MSDQSRVTRLAEDDDILRALRRIVLAYNSHDTDQAHLELLSFDQANFEKERRLAAAVVYLLTRIVIETRGTTPSDADLDSLVLDALSGYQVNVRDDGGKLRDVLQGAVLRRWTVPSQDIIVYGAAGVAALVPADAASWLDATASSLRPWMARLP